MRERERGEGQMWGCHTRKKGSWREKGAQRGGSRQLIVAGGERAGKECHTIGEDCKGLMDIVGGIQIVKRKSCELLVRKRQ